jgi:hypothetical protein
VQPRAAADTSPAHATALPVQDRQGLSLTRLPPGQVHFFEHNFVVQHHVLLFQLPQPDLDPVQTPLLSLHVLALLGLLQAQHAAQPGDRQILAEQPGDLLQGKAQVLTFERKRCLGYLLLYPESSWWYKRFNRSFPTLFRISVGSRRLEKYCRKVFIFCRCWSEVCRRFRGRGG